MKDGKALSDERVKKRQDKREGRKKIAKRENFIFNIKRAFFSIFSERTAS